MFIDVLHKRNNDLVVYVNVHRLSLIPLYCFVCALHVMFVYQYGRTEYCDYELINQSTINAKIPIKAAIVFHWYQ